MTVISKLIQVLFSSSARVLNGERADIGGAVSAGIGRQGSPGNVGTHSTRIEDGDLIPV